ncbi:EmrB/QacA subfamily drug resistance transporter [Actinomadura luteofluorescens]|uniref:EmrB/QacA subfamily drug resistance transporter n=1 Tax=Actinomadura luteofluorescens TaxID=46163 RepID=A0A7Y9EIG8_9ACTN|nr:MFS transporter [Actinomadura luteofluorescens]NYD48364.1 EmrB/QacA subfamily drug resistance transporter [Actinomadura luteofluorescens]
MTALTTAVAAPPERMSSRHKLVLTLLLGAQFMLAIDFSILNVALPVVGRGLGFGLDELQWIATAFALPAAGFTLLFGRVADLAGRRRMLLAGMALLAGGSLVGGLATSPAMLLVGRVLQGLATAIATPAALSLLTTSFPEGPLRTRALGLSGALMSAGFTVGAILGGVLTDLLSWRWAFLVNVPVAVLIFAVTPAVVAESRSRDGARLDVPGAVTVTGGLLALVYGITSAGSAGWGSPAALGALVAAAVLLTAFILVERRSPAPLAPLNVLTRRTVTWGNVGGFVAFATETSLVFLMTLYLQKVLGFSPLATGLALGVLGAGTFAGGVAAPRIMGRFGGRATLVSGLVLQAAATAALLGLGDSRGALGLLLAATAIGGFGNLVAIVAFMGIATSGLPDGEQGLATGLATMTQQVAITLGIPVMSAVATANASVLGGVHTATAVNVAIVLAGAALAGSFLRRS